MKNVYCSRYHIFCGFVELSQFLYVRRRVLCSPNDLICVRLRVLYYPNNLCYFLRLSRNFFLGFSDLPNNEITNNLYVCDSVILSFCDRFSCVIISLSKYLPSSTEFGTHVPQCITSGWFFVFFRIFHSYGFY